MPAFDLVIRSGTVVDGTGNAARVADVAVRDGVVVDVGRVEGRGAREIDADGAVVAPGFVDVHTHYDGQAVWDGRMQPSSWHGVTTVVMGNCGVGFAPVAPENRQMLIELMEGVEDIPGTALHEGLNWEWETFEEYLRTLERRPRDLDVAAQVPHAALRFAAMGERAAARQAATGDEVAVMARLAAEAIRSGALGFTTSRTINHKSVAGTLTPVYGSQGDELTAIAAAVGRTGTGVLQLITDFDDVDEDFALMRRMVAASGRPLTVSLVQFGSRPRLYSVVLEHLARANEDGYAIRAQVAARSMGMLLGLQCTLHPFVTNRVWRSISHLPVAEQAARMADPGLKAEILRAQTDEKLQNVPGGLRIDRYDIMYEFDEVPDYEPAREDSIAARAARAGRTPEDLSYDLLIKDSGRSMIFQPFTNYADGNLDAVREMLAHDHTLPGLSDGGAHVASICDGSFPTTLLQLWTRDRDRDRLDLPFVIRRQCRETAVAVGLEDRGLLASGYKADINIIDMDNLRLLNPTVRYDLPAGGRRLLQRAEGYLHTFVSGVETYTDGEETGELPGRLVRGAQRRREGG
ncbi:N-acyl-D-amino-acid deacylase family protein [Pseudofrankia asymbiotica]|uniref:Amidohydrolase n=1 Tax=Pseudofrankia asymbiotica TaxID=1834516 RepID=A0A1V2IF68_9ACTN|nr:amidohydrolase family protein [Pseudofrankia asymbiotica]ONH31660.1 amidohydrolase [Pseudofrankia asymbiotica]